MSSIKRRAAFFVVALALSAAAMAFDPEGLRRTLALRQDVARIRAENEALRKANEKLRVELRLLQDDPDALERAAREELGLVRPDEVIFRLEGEDASRGR